MIYLEAYKDYLIKIAILLGASLNNATVHAEELIEFETQLATVRINVFKYRCINFSQMLRFCNYQLNDSCRITYRLDYVLV